MEFSVSKPAVTAIVNEHGRCQITGTATFDTSETPRRDARLRVQRRRHRFLRGMPRDLLGSRRASCPATPWGSLRLTRSDGVRSALDDARVGRRPRRRCRAAPTEPARARVPQARSTPRRARSLRRRSTATSSLAQGVLVRRTPPGRPVPRPSSVSAARSRAIASSPRAFDASLDRGAVMTVAGSYGCHTATGSHTDSTTASRVPSISPALAMACAASSEPSKQSRTGRLSIVVLLRFGRAPIRSGLLGGQQKCCLPRVTRGARDRIDMGRAD